MSDLIQYVEIGTQYDDFPIKWDGNAQYVVPATNRTRILNREAEKGIHPGDDGWLTCSRLIGSIEGQDLWIWTRIRWEPLPHTDSQDLDGGGE